jgi:hypothetical protein
MADPLTRRDLHFAARANAIKAAGGEVRTDAIQRSVAEDLRLVDRAKAEGKLGQRRKAKKKHAPKFTDRPGVARPELHAEALARQSGAQFFARAVKDERPASPTAALTGVAAERMMAMQRRILLLSQRGAGRLKNNQTIEQGPWLYPTFARLIVTTTVAFNAGLGGYKDLRPADRRRRYFRALEDICNKSDAAVGVGWWVRK